MNSMIANFRGFGKFRHLETFCFDGCFRMLLENSNSVPYRLLSTNPDTCLFALKNCHPDKESLQSVVVHRKRNRSIVRIHTVIVGSKSHACKRKQHILIFHPDKSKCNSPWNHSHRTLLWWGTQFHIMQEKNISPNRKNSFRGAHLMQIIGFAVLAMNQNLKTQKPKTHNIIRFLGF